MRPYPPRRSPYRQDRDPRVTSAGRRRWLTMLAASMACALAVPVMTGEVVASAAGTAWSIVPTPAVASGSPLAGVSCVSASYCMAVGYSEHNCYPCYYSILIEHWDGHSWSVMPSPTPRAQPKDESQGTFLTGVSCISSTWCMAVGIWDDKQLAMSWNGRSWTLTAIASSVLGQLSAVSCTSATWCAAVGYEYTQSTRALLDTWDGKAWSTVVGHQSHQLEQGVSCVSPSWCMAVGDVSERWDGKQWSPLAAPAGNTRTFNAVSCTSPSACLAAGSQAIVLEPGRMNPPGHIPAAEAWDGSHWSVVANPYKRSVMVQASLSSVTCSNAKSCVAVGAASQVGDPLIESWEGSGLTVVPSPHVAGKTTSLAGVSCLAAGPCIAVGSSEGSAPVLAAFVEMS
jgi:hypothetical protein